MSALTSVTVTVAAVTNESVPTSIYVMESRKANKPLMEKKRRARINKSLNELKNLLIESSKRNAPGHSKWEKADILEMTVQYLYCLKNQQKSNRTDPMSIGQFIAGFSECVRQIQKFSEDHTVDVDNRRRLIEYLLVYLKSFTDDATKSLKSPTDRLSPKHIPSPSGTCSSSPISLSPQLIDEDAMIVDERHHPNTASPDDSVCAFMISCDQQGSCNERSQFSDSEGVGSVWRPW